jgi:acyl-CoA thioesterase
MVQTIVQKMMQEDLFSQWLGIEIIEHSPGYCKQKMTVRKEMCNGHGITHGGISYSFADSALAFASNSQGKKCMSIETSISHLKRIITGDVLVATAVERSLSHRLGVYDITVAKEDGTIVALFKGTVYRKEEQWEV